LPRKSVIGNRRKQTRNGRKHSVCGGILPVWEKGGRNKRYCTGRANPPIVIFNIMELFGNPIDPKKWTKKGRG